MRGPAVESASEHKKTEPVRTERPAAQPRRHRVSDLLQGDREVILEHSGQDYRLRITANGKLILTK
jgi:hemin uptake protein HemP